MYQNDEFPFIRINKNLRIKSISRSSPDDTKPQPKRNHSQA